jgi:hypothetical protein
VTVCSQNLTLGALSSRSALSMLVGALFKMFDLLLNTPRIFAVSIISMLVSQIVKTNFGRFIGSSSELLKEN